MDDFALGDGAGPYSKTPFEEAIAAAEEEGRFLDDYSTDDPASWADLMAADDPTSAPLGKMVASMGQEHSLMAMAAISCPALNDPNDNRAPRGAAAAAAAALAAGATRVMAHGAANTSVLSNLSRVAGTGARVPRTGIEQQRYNHQQRCNHQQRDHNHEPCQTGQQLELQEAEGGVGMWDHRDLACFLHKLPEVPGAEQLDSLCLAHLVWTSA